jgi:ADP-ribose pyrophosphatase YjhB (NUDIX family)
MTDVDVPRWLLWAREIQALSQTGLAYSETDYDLQRYHRLTEIAAEIIESHSDLSQQQALDHFLMQPGYATPKVDVRAAVVRDGQILLVQEREDQRWCMPGGWADVGDVPSEAAAREVWEESGFEVVVKKLIGAFDANRDGGRPLELYHAFKLVFWCEITGGEARSSSETLDVGFFAFDDLPPLSSNRTNERHLAEVQAHLKDPRRPSAFD